MAFTKRYQEQIEEYQQRIDDLTLELTAAKMENERLTAECKAWDAGRDELVEGHEVQLAEYLEQIQHLLDRIEVLEETVKHHLENCLPEFKNYTSHNDDVTTTER